MSSKSYFFALLVFSSFCWLSDTSFAANWTSFQGDQRNSGYNPVVGPGSSLVKWTYQSNSAVYSPSVNGAGDVYFANENSQLTRVDSTGSLMWIFDSNFTSNDPPSPEMVPVVFPDGIVAYVAHQGILNAQTSENGIVFGVTTRGRHKWEFMPAGFGGWIKSNLALGINNDIIITDFSNTPTASVSFLDFITGQLLSYVHPYPHGYQYDAEGVALDVDNEHLYLGGGNQVRSFFCIDMSNQSILWEYPGLSERVQMEPTVLFNGDVVFSSIDGKLYCLSPTGSLNWTYQVSGNINTSCATAPSGNIYFGATDGALYSLSSNGQFRWAFPTTHQIFSAPAIDQNERIYFANQIGEIFSLDSAGNQVWAYSSGSSILGSPALADNGTLYFPSGNELIAFNDSTPTPIPTCPPSLVLEQCGESVPPNQRLTFKVSNAEAIDYASDDSFILLGNRKFFLRDLTSSGTGNDINLSLSLPIEFSCGPIVLWSQVRDLCGDLTFDYCKLGIEDCEAPTIALAGYLDTNLKSDTSPQTLSLGVILEGNDVADFDVVMEYQGFLVRFPINPQDLPYLQFSWSLESPMPPSSHLFEVYLQSPNTGVQNLSWPFLNIDP